MKGTDIVSNLGLNWFDGFTVIVLVVGFLVGRKRGMSAELLDVFQWLLMVVVAGYGYQHVGALIAKTSVFSRLFCLISGYVLCLVAVKIGFMMVSKGLGGKLAGSDIFGRAEYYLGMFAGAIRFACMLIAVLALIHAPYISKEDIARKAAAQKENFGSISFPTGGGIQGDIFSSMSGSWIERHLSNMLIEPTSSKDKGTDLRKKDSISRKREKLVDELTK